MNPPSLDDSINGHGDQLASASCEAACPTSAYSTVNDSTPLPAPPPATENDSLIQASNVATASAVTTVYLPKTMLQASAETQLLEPVTLSPPTTDAPFDLAVMEEVHIDMAAPPSLPVYQETSEEVAAHMATGIEGNRKLMWTALLAFIVLTSTQAICVRLPNVIRPDDVLPGGAYIMSYLCGEVVPMLSFTLYNLYRHPINMGAWKSFSVGLMAGACNIVGIAGILKLNAQGGETSLLVPLTNLYIIVPVACGMLFLGDKPTLKKGLGIALGVGATMMFAFGGGSDFDLGQSSTLSYFFMCFIGWAVCTPLYQVIGLLSEARYTAGYMGSVIGFFLMGIIMAATVMGGARLDSFDIRNMCIFFGGLTHGGANIAFMGLSYAMPGQASVVAPLASLYVVVPVTVGMAAFDESVTALKILGIFVAIFAVLLLSINSLSELRDLICGTKASAIIAKQTLEVLPKDDKLLVPSGTPMDTMMPPYQATPARITMPACSLNTLSHNV